MDLRHLRCFIAVAEEQSFSRAAERLHIEQSPLSRTIKKLESDLGVVLLERTSRGTRLTWAGQVPLRQDSCRPDRIHPRGQRTRSWHDTEKHSRTAR